MTTHVESVEEDLCDVSGDGNVCEIAFRASRFVAIVDERINQSLQGRQIRLK